MKHILRITLAAAALCAAAITAKAGPILTINPVQDNWRLYLYVVFSDYSGGEFAHSYIDGVDYGMTFGGNPYQSFVRTPFMAGDPASVGFHTYSTLYTKDGIDTLLEGSWTINEPFGERPRVFTDDGGASAGLLLTGLAGLALMRRKWARGAH